MENVKETRGALPPKTLFWPPLPPKTAILTSSDYWLFITF